MNTFPDKYRVTPNHSLAHRYPTQYLTNNGDNQQGCFNIPRKGRTGSYFFCVVSTGMGWEHVSVSIPSEMRCPTWEEMCYIKDIFWEKDQVVVQFHPAEKDYVNRHEHCLHLWRPTDQTFPVPQKIMVG